MLSLEYIKDEDKTSNPVLEHEHILAATATCNIAEAKNAAREHIDNQNVSKKYQGTGRCSLGARPWKKIAGNVL